MKKNEKKFFLKKMKKSRMDKKIADSNAHSRMTGCLINSTLFLNDEDISTKADAYNYLPLLQCYHMTVATRREKAEQ